MKLKLSLLSIIMSAAASGAALAEPLCEVDYKIQHSWPTGATHRVNIVYHGPAIDSWTLGWTFPGGEVIDSIFNSTASQTGDSVLLKSAGWNSRIRPGSHLDIGFNVSNPSGKVPTSFSMNGQSCDGGDQTPSNPPTNPPPATTADNWELDTTQSYLNFVTTKKLHVVETHRFDGLSGSVSDKGEASLVIDLASANTGIAIRDQRLDDLLFQVAQFPSAVVTIALADELAALQAMAPGESLKRELSAQLALHGQTRTVPTKLRIQRLTDKRFLVQSLSPVIVKAEDFELGAGIDALKQVASLTSISTAVPVDFALFFDAK